MFKAVWVEETVFFQRYLLIALQNDRYEEVEEDQSKEQQEGKEEYQRTSLLTAAYGLD